MKRATVALLTLATASCCVRPQISTCVPVVSADQVSRRVEATQSSLNEAMSAAQKQKQSINAAKTLNEHMDAKTTILLEHWK